MNSPSARNISPAQFARQQASANKMVRLRKAMGARIRQLRKGKRWSQKVLASLCRIHRSHLARVERGEINFRLSTIKTIAKQLHTSVAELFRGIG